MIGGRYRLVRALGQGTLTETWEAIHIELERGVAIKFVRRPEPGVAERMVEEARAIAKIRHPHVLEYSDFGRTEQGQPFFVMELLSGQTVEQLLARRRVIPWARALAIVQQVGEALGAAHQHRIVHRDLRPGNVFLVDVGQAADFVKVVDFGLARASVLGGTPSYMSPEQCRGEPLDPRSDVYALGCLLVAMVTGDPPFVGDPQRVIRQQLEDPPKSLRERAPRQFIPDELEAIVARCLAKQPDQRFVDTRELAGALAQLARFGAATSIVGAPMVDSSSASGSRPMGYAGRPPPKSPRELTDSYKPVNQPIADDSEREGKRASNRELNPGAIAAATLAGLLAVGGMGVGMYWLVNRLIDAGENVEAQAAPEASERAVQTPAAAPAPAPPPSPPVATPEPVAVPEQVEPAAIAAERAESAPDSAALPAEEKPAEKAASKSRAKHAAEEHAAEPASPTPEPAPEPAPAPEPESKPAKPSVEPDSKAKDKIGHEDLLDPWG